MTHNLLSMLGKTHHLPVPTSNRNTRPPSPEPQETRFNHVGYDYAHKYIEEERELYRTTHVKREEAIERKKEKRGTLSQVDSTVFTGENDEDNAGLSVYENYNFDYHSDTNNKLTIMQHKKKILSLVNISSVVIIKAETGCGKTTKVPQFILDDYRERRQYCNIVVTQPRRLAAISVAKRVSNERNWPLGSIVGYQIGREKNTSTDTRLLYCTTGVLLQKFVVEKHMNSFTHVILDEVHEREQDMDFLLIVVRKLMNLVSKNTKVILMSATIQTIDFYEYFNMSNAFGKYGPDTIVIQGNTNFTVTIFYIDNIKKLVHETTLLDLHEPKISKDMYMTAVRLIQNFDHIEKDKTVIGSVLVFLPGLHEIEEVVKYLEQMKYDVINGQQKEFLWWIKPLHSSLTQEEQSSVFSHPPKGYRKILLSTNIAESSITVPDIRYVIDFCLTKSLVMNEETNYPCLQLEWCSKSSLKQRSGRVGRVSEGRVYRLITEEFYKSLDEDSQPEMKRAPLDQLVLKAKLLDMGEPVAIFSLALTVPDLSNIENTILNLKEVGALLLTSDGKYHPTDGDITTFGKLAAVLPMDIRLSKLIFVGNLFGVYQEAVIIACSMSVHNMFSTPFKKYLEAYNSRLAWADSSCSDCVAYFHAYEVWRQKSVDGMFKVKSRRSEDPEVQWGQANYVQVKVLRDIATIQSEVEDRLKHFEVQLDGPRQAMSATERAVFIKLSLAAAFYPNYFIRSHNEMMESTAARELSGLDPFSTVYLTPYPNNQPPLIYTDVIKKEFANITEDLTVYFSDVGNKVMVQFGHVGVERTKINIPGRISMAVYQAIKMGKKTKNITIPVLPSDVAKNRYEQLLRRRELKKLAASKLSSDSHIKGIIPWPWNGSVDKYEEYVRIFISHMENPQRFYAQPTLAGCKELLKDIKSSLNEEGNLIDGMEFHVGQLCAGLYTDNMYYRVRILDQRNKELKVLFVDYGNVKYLPTNKLKLFGQKIESEHLDKKPALAIECSLSKIQPSSRYELWTEDVCVKVIRQLVGKSFNTKIYSFVNGVLSLKLFGFPGLIQDAPQSVRNAEGILVYNKYLVHEKLAESAEESYLSMMSHVERKRLKSRIDSGEGEIMSRNENLLKSSLSCLDPGETVEDIFTPDDIKNCVNVIKFFVPKSPLEMTLHSLPKCSESKEIHVSPRSVNSVLLDTNPSDPFDRLIVAHGVRTNVFADSLSLDDTTIMPSFPELCQDWKKKRPILGIIVSIALASYISLPSLLCLMFAPFIELRRSDDGSCITGALCGLGYDNNSRSYHSDHDIDLVFDTKITLKHLEVINKIRHYLNEAFDNTADKTPLRTCANKLCHFIAGLLNNEVIPQEKLYYTTSHKWNIVPSEKLLPPHNVFEEGKYRPMSQLNTVFRFIWGIKLEQSEPEDTEKLGRKLEELQIFIAGSETSTRKNVECVLCNVMLSNQVEAAIHVKTMQHKAREQRIAKSSNANKNDGPSSISAESSEYDDYRVYQNTPEIRNPLPGRLGDALSRNSYKSQNRTNVWNSRSTVVHGPANPQNFVVHSNKHHKPQYGKK